MEYKDYLLVWEEDKLTAVEVATAIEEEEEKRIRYEMSIL